MSSYDSWKLRSDRDDVPQDEPPVDEGKPDQQEDGFLELKAAAKAMVAEFDGFSAAELKRRARTSHYYCSVTPHVLAFRRALAKLEP